MDKQRIAIVGAGPMGLAAAYQIACAGHIPVLFESGDRIGGMTACFDFSGVEIERFYHFHCTSDEDFMDLLQELGIQDKLRWRPTKMGYFFENELQQWGNPIALLKFKGLSLNAKIRYAVHAFLCTKRSDWSKLDKVEATSWLRDWVGAEAYEKLWKRLFEYKFYDQADQLSAAWIWARIRRIGRSRYTFMTEKLGFIEGGSKTYLNALSDAIVEKGGEIRVSHPVEEIVLDGDRVSGIKYQSSFEHFDHIISTVPLPYVPKLIPDLPTEIRAKYEEQRNVGVVCVIVKLRRRLTENFWVNVNDNRMDIPGIVEYSNLRPLGASTHIVYAPFYMPIDNPRWLDPNDVFTEKVRKYIKLINSDLTDEDIIAVHASRYKFSQPICGPEFLSTLPPVKLPIKGLWVADTSYYYPEDRGISESTGLGRRIAKNVLMEL
ncbi:NAD(P)/FAD-dependent oxidoreductase [Planktomarina temperata]|nr:NAD(P)/FAD-dependent oxidoreductase [Planktomarina temperata]